MAHKITTAIARKTDPQTSHTAARKVEACGTAANQRALCLGAVWNNPGKTAAELAEIVGLERHVPSRRLPELRTAGEVENGESRICTVTGNLSMTWRLVFRRNLFEV